MKQIVTLAALVVCATLALSSSAAAQTTPAIPRSITTPDKQKPNPLRNAYFVETHVHTSWSFDAHIIGNHITGPADAPKLNGTFAFE